MKYGIFKIGSDICLITYDTYEQALERIQNSNEYEIREIIDTSKVRLW
jgi:hypothetical protein